MAATVSPENPGFLARIGVAFTAAFHSIGVALTVNSTAEARLHEVQRLQALSDAELSKLGIARDKIVQHVFRDIYLI